MNVGGSDRYVLEYPAWELFSSLCQWQCICSKVTGPNSGHWSRVVMLGRGHLTSWFPRAQDDGPLRGTEDGGVTLLTCS